MKKTYQKPALVRREQLSKVTASAAISDFANGGAVNGSLPTDEL